MVPAAPSRKQYLVEVQYQLRGIVQVKQFRMLAMTPQRAIGNVEALLMTSVRPEAFIQSRILSWSA